VKINERLRLLRSKLELSQQDAASKFDIPAGSWKKYELGPSEPGSGALRNLAIGGVNIHWLLTGEGDMLLTEEAWEDWTERAKEQQKQPPPDPQTPEEHAKSLALVGSPLYRAVGETLESAVRERQLTLNYPQIGVLQQLIAEYCAATGTHVPLAVQQFLLLFECATKS